MLHSYLFIEEFVFCFCKMFTRSCLIWSAILYLVYYLVSDDPILCIL